MARRWRGRHVLWTDPTVVRTGAPGSVAAAQLVVKAGRQTSPERDVTDEPRRLPPPANGGGQVSLSRALCACHQNHRNPPLPVATHEMRRLEVSATWRRHWLMLQDGRDASCRPGCLSIPVIIVGEYAATAHIANRWACIMITQLMPPERSLLYNKGSFFNVERLHFRLSQGHL